MFTWTQRRGVRDLAETGHVQVGEAPDKPPPKTGKQVWLITSPEELLKTRLHPDQRNQRPLQEGAGRSAEACPARSGKEAALRTAGLEDDGELMGVGGHSWC